MDLILWRHAEAEEPAGEVDDLGRNLTPRGVKQAARMAVWLDRQLPDSVRIFASPARRTHETVQALGRKFRLRPELAPGCSVAQLLEVAQWPHGKGQVMIVGHQPVLGQTVAQILGLAQPELSIKKGAVWWLRSRQRDELPQVTLLAVQSADML
ncbi:SixA phosphatase family protein [Variovorax sp. HJSM1_2]|uniref:SixA phosphatase family protein n=1 Tax=Variovorax sp. HJSM1_2 TaxID=3366263 RepID=UPI003BC81970